jgi:anti-sigma factor RsiW
VSCARLEPRIGAYLDDELDAPARREVERHLGECPACRVLHARRRALGAALRERLPAFAAPDVLRGRLEGALLAARAVPKASSPDAAVVRRWRWTAVAAAALLAVTTGYGVLAPRGGGSPDEAIAHDVLSSHVRSLMPEHLTDVASNDQHNVKPWFNGRLDYSPPVHDLAPHGFPLVGGRLDYVGGRPVAALVYQRRKHVINLWVWPEERAGQRAPEVTRQGYHLLRWTHAGMTRWAVSDLSGDELREFVRLEQQVDSVAAAREGAR